jgi:predicted enzyme related to lactoylglutathione lyase
MLIPPPHKGVTMDMKLELVAVPVADIDRAKAFYVEQVGFHADHDVPVDENLRFVQLTPPGSACSIVLDVTMTSMPAGAVQGLQVVVDDADAAYEYLVARGVAAEPVVEFPWGRFTFFADPDGNRWACQQIVRR